MPEEENKKPDINEQPTGQISRREFLRDAGLVFGGATIGSIAILGACGTVNTETVTSTITRTVTGAGSTATVTSTSTGAPAATKTVTVTTGSPAVTVTKVAETAVASTNTVNLIVNGKTYEQYVEPEWTLQFVLNDRMGMTGTKEWCDQGACGSCTVNMDGRPILACMTLAISCEGKKIETVEGIAEAGHPLIQAYASNHCMQCGYCTPGFVVTAKALLDKNNNPTEEQIRSALSGNICRCSTYPKHPKAIMDAAKVLRGGK
jgi:aerobic-type carbon monoxide dehydrogenase small subunit (CoxS/CutS family)